MRYSVENLRQNSNGKPAFLRPVGSYNLDSSGCENPWNSRPTATDEALILNFNGSARAMAIILSERAASEVKKVLEEQKQAEGTLLRVRVVGGGCSGFSYDLRFDNTVRRESSTRNTSITA